MKLLPIDVSSFDKLIQRDFIYVDKTKYIYDLYSKGGNYHFLSRPRRFGKTLLVSTLHELFSGNKKLFKGLWIEKSDWQWKEHPVIHLDLSTIFASTPQGLQDNLNDDLRLIASKCKLDIPQKNTPERTLVTMVNKLSEIHGLASVVVLIDEYDYPILQTIGEDLEKACAYRKVLKNFYATLKGLDKHLRAIFLTGVTKFSKTSIFSGLNNLNDISLKKEGSLLLGYTDHELQEYFGDYVKNIAHKQNVSIKSIREKMKRWYNGYRFSAAEETRVYNPFSVLYFLKDEEIHNYWFETGTPTFLIDVLRKQFYSLQDLKASSVTDKEALGAFELNEIPFFTLLFQTGYLTIASYDKQTLLFTLDYPNEEVRLSIARHITALLSCAKSSEVPKTIALLTKALEKNDIEAFCETIQSLFANIPYNLHIEQEKYFHSLLQAIGMLLDSDVQSEVMTDKGRMDLVITTKTHTYIFEIKFKATPETALAQIKRNKYYERFVIKRKKIVLIGLSFGYLKKKLNVRWKIEELGRAY
jgi:hypothetical protein